MLDVSATSGDVLSFTAEIPSVSEAILQIHKCL